jgi:hypothetical protein
MIHEILQLPGRLADLALLGKDSANHHHLAASVQIDISYRQILVIPGKADAIKFCGSLP